MSITVAEFVEVAADGGPASPSRNARTLAYWRAAQNTLLLAGALLVGLLVYFPGAGLAILWNILIPVAPALIVVAPGLWLQKITTKEPDESQMEVSLAAIRAALRMDGVTQSAGASKVAVG